MANTVIIIIRTLLGLLGGCAGIFAILAGLYMLVDRNFVLFGGPGLVSFVGVTIGALFLYGSWRLLTTANGSGFSQFER